MLYSYYTWIEDEETVNAMSDRGVMYKIMVHIIFNESGEDYGAKNDGLWSKKYCIYIFMGNSWLWGQKDENHYLLQRYSIKRKYGYTRFICINIKTYLEQCF